MKTYTILPDHSLTDNTGKACTGGDTIDLDDAAAKQFAHCLAPAHVPAPDAEQAKDSHHIDPE